MNSPSLLRFPHSSFDPVIDRRHGGFPANAIHITDLDFTKVSDTPIDPTGKWAAPQPPEVFDASVGTSFPHASVLDVQSGGSVSLRA